MYDARIKAMKIILFRVTNAEKVIIIHTFFLAKTWKIKHHVFSEKRKTQIEFRIFEKTHALKQ